MMRIGCPPLSRSPRSVPNAAAPRSGRGVADAAFAAEMPCRFRSVHLLFSFRTCRSILSMAAPSAACASRPVALLGDLAYRRGDREMSGGKFETHGRCRAGLDAPPP
ncbi:MAG: hypothetical protein DMF87_01445 [Acidobacteria bacterium]|nr:MAG: hypothetical protein DMF87_01445 [Acidobacteriota bacterium]